MLKITEQVSSRAGPGCSYLDDSFPRDISHQEIHGNVFTVHMSVHPVLDVPRHFVGIQVIKILLGEETKRRNIQIAVPSG